MKTIAIILLLTVCGGLRAMEPLFPDDDRDFQRRDERCAKCLIYTAVACDATVVSAEDTLAPGMLRNLAQDRRFYRVPIGKDEKLVYYQKRCCAMTIGAACIWGIFTNCFNL